MADGAALGMLGLCLLVSVVLLIVTSITSVAPTEMALRYNSILQTVSPEVIQTPGIQFVGPWASLMRYPKTIQTIDFEDKKLLDGRTKDGLPLILGIAFQYRLLPDGLYELYHKYEQRAGDYERVYRLIGIHLITELATEFTAYQFFNEKQKIAEVMRSKLDDFFVKNLHATVESLQINEDDLPSAFTDAVLEAATCKQNITKMTKTRDARLVEFKTARLVAEAQANVTVQKAIGESHQIIQNGQADAAIIEAFVEAELGAYGKIHTDLGLSGASLIQYIWYDSLGGGGVQGSSNHKDVNVLVGVNPAAYINQQVRAP
eukprot:gnl/TRDRNA2_/TRDRNA2_192381_c0_seq1.p1 gnl/TRDRNA2_/TRDRNA2_192381_c0~~gnl/TRDRNA2_/TRDRNA2_192381_c0_seq1.p1  ORF type:complete len:318 (+),score=60.60 gnl/TRDRNA2_/TRDRNA2_192381_c0_seq1:72-1025(+)